MATICKDIMQLDKDTREALEIFLDVCNGELGLNLKVTETYRTVERQKELYAQGRTTAGKVVTNCDGVKSLSIHQTRRAFDVCHNKRGDEYNDTVLRKAGEVGKRIGLTWGGSWGWDSPHFELGKGVKPKDIRKKTDEAHNKNIDELNRKGYTLDKDAWYDGKINLKNVPALLQRLGGLDALVKQSIITEHTRWSNGSYKEQDVKALIDKAAAKLKQKSK